MLEQGFDIGTRVSAQTKTFDAIAVASVFEIKFIYLRLYYELVRKNISDRNYFAFSHTEKTHLIDQIGFLSARYPETALRKPR